MTKLLVVIDMVNGFINEGALADKKINQITNNVVNLVEKAISNNVKVFSFRDEHQLGDEEFNVFPLHCLTGTNESELIPELEPFKNKMLDIPKNTTNGFNTEKFAKIINIIPFDEIGICGCCTDICVKDFTLSLLNFLKAKQLTTPVYVYKDAIATFDSAEHNAQIESEKAINDMKNKGAIFINTPNKTKDFE